MKRDIGISELTLNDVFEGFYLLASAQLKTSSNNSTFLSATLSDCSGSIDAKAWDYAGPVGDADTGKVVKVRGKVGEYRGALQVTIDKIRLATESDQYNVEDLVPTAPIDVEKETEGVKDLIATIEDTDYRKICEEMLRRYLPVFISIPAAKSVHHSFLHGLLMHTSYMLKTADFLSNLYGDIADRNLLLAGTFLHDFAKRIEFNFSDLGLVTSYSVKGQLLGHLVMGAQEVAEVARELSVPDDKSVLLQHLILSHHGTPEFGAAVVPKCVEAELLSYIDLIDSRMEIYREALANLQPGEVSDYVFGLDKRIYRHE